MAIGILGILVFIAVLLLIVNRKLLLYYFVFLYPILPEYLAVSFSDSLPLFTASRLLLIILVFSVLAGKRINLRVFKIKYFGKAFIFYFLCETVVCIAHYNNMNSIKSYIGVILENLVFLICITTLVNTREKYNGCVKALILGAVVVFVMGILEPITKVNLASTYLDTGSRTTMLISSYERYNSVRAVFTFGHAIALGVYCVTILPFIMNKINKTKDLKYYILVDCKMKLDT